VKVDLIEDEKKSNDCCRRPEG